MAPTSEICSTLDGAFGAYGIDSSAALVGPTHYRMIARHRREVEPTPGFVRALAASFREAYVRAADVPIVPESVDAAVTVAADATAHRLLDDPDRDLRTEVVPSFYRRVARFYCEAGEPGTDDVGVWIDPDGR